MVRFYVQMVTADSNFGKNSDSDKWSVMQDDSHVKHSPENSSVSGSTLFKVQNEGDEVVLDPAKSSLTVIGEADPVCIIKQVRKFRRTAQITSVGPPPKEEKKDEKKDAFPALPRTCQRCDVWYVVGEDYYSHCNIL